MAQKKLSKTRQKIHQIYEENELANLESNKYRARSFTVGTTTGGILEVGMRGDYGHLWYILQPVEAVEIIGQIAAAAGIEIAMRPKQDFSAWRSWDTSLPNSTFWVGAAPWQLPEEERYKIEEAKAKNIKAIESGEDQPNEHQ
jgi:hypothetical protein